MTRSKTPARALLLTAILLATIGTAKAESPANCIGFGNLAAKPDLATARIVGPAPHAPFLKNASEAAGCPAATEACREKAYLVPGNAVIAGAVRNGFTCVDYVGAKGDDRAGWMATASVAREPGSPIAESDWIGLWVRQEASVALKPGPGRMVTLHGDATWGASDPDRVKRGAVNVGEIDATFAPDGPNLAFDVGDKSTLPVDQGGEDDCKVWLRRLGPYLLVDDNLKCGGMNVSFRGIYRRSP